MQARIEEYRPIVRHLARGLMRGVPGQLDQLANGAEDYEQMLWVQAWEAIQRASSDCREPAKERSYVVSALYNAARNHHRYRSAECRQAEITPAYPEILLDESWEVRLEIRRYLDRLFDELPRDLAVALLAVALSGGRHVGATRTLQRHTKEARQRAGVLARSFLECV